MMSSEEHAVPVEPEVLLTAGEIASKLIHEAGGSPVNCTRFLDLFFGESDAYLTVGTNACLRNGDGCELRGGSTMLFFVPDAGDLGDKGERVRGPFESSPSESELTNPWGSTFVSINSHILRK